MSDAPDGSVIERASPRPDLVAFEVRDRVTKADIEWMSSIADRAMEKYDKFDMLIIMSNFQGSDIGAKLDGYAAGVMARSVAHIRRYVVVGAPVLAEAMINVSGLVMPVQTKTFSLEDEAAAWVFLAQPLS